MTVPLVGAVDTAIAGHLDGVHATAAAIGGVGLGGVLFSTVFWTFGFLRMSATGMTAQAVGQEDHARSALVFWRGMIIALLGALVILAVFPFALPALLAAQDAEPAVRIVTAEYAAIRVWSAPAVLINMVILGRFFGMGDPRRAMIHQIVINAANMGLNVLLAFELGLGIAGIALGTVIADYLGAALGLALLAHKGWPKKFGGGLWRDWGEFLRLNHDILLRTLFLLLAYFIFTRASAQLGANTLAANTIMLQFLSLTAFGLDGIAFALEAMVGKVWGRLHSAAKSAKDHIELTLTIREGHRVACAIAIGFALVFGLFGSLLVGLFTDSQIVQAEIGMYWLWFVLLPITGVWCWTWDGVFIGTTQGKLARNAMLIALIVFVAILWPAVELWGNHGAWLAYHLYSITRALTLWWAWRKIVVNRLP